MTELCKCSLAVGIFMDPQGRHWARCESGVCNYERAVSVLDVRPGRMMGFEEAHRCHGLCGWDFQPLYGSGPQGVMDLPKARALAQALGEAASPLLPFTGLVSTRKCSV